MESRKREYKPLTIPRLTWQKKVCTDTYGELVAQPLEPGFGTTLGNALRRVLLSSIEGASVTSVIVKGINNEFSPLPGVEEDAMQMMLNIKGVVVRSEDGMPGQMRLKVSGEGVARVSDIVADENLVVVNGEHVIAHLAPEGELDITFFVEPGRGYVPAQWPLEQAYQPDGRVYLDAMFSPVRRVMFDVEKTRVGKDIDYDKLTLRIFTDGSETPGDVLHYAVSVLRTQLEHFLVAAEIPFNELASAPEQEEEDAPVELGSIDLQGIPAEVLLKPIEELELSVRAHNCLINAGVKRVVDLIVLTEDDVLRIKNFGRKSLNEVKESVKAFGKAAGHPLSLGMEISEDDVKKLTAHVEN